MASSYNDTPVEDGMRYGNSKKKFSTHHLLLTYRHGRFYIILFTHLTNLLTIDTVSSLRDPWDEFCLTHSIPGDSPLSLRLFSP